MSQKRILLLLEYVRVDHVKEKNGEVELDFLGSKMGANLKRKLKSVGIKMDNVDIEYVYNQVPEAKQINYKTKKPVSYVDPTLKQVSGRFEYIEKVIIDKQYDIVIPTGKLGCKLLLGATAITTLRGVPEKKKLEHESAKHNFWVFPMYSMEFITAKPNNEVLYDADLATLKKYVDEGDLAFTPSETHYEYVKDFNRVREIFAFLKKERPVSSWDLETNTLMSSRAGAKALVISISWEETQGVTIPMEHKDSPWSPEEFKELLALITDYVADENQLKVLQNGQYDIRFLMAVYGIKKFEKNVDTKIMYYLMVSQEASKSFKLTDLAYEMTDMGGYDKPLEIWKKKYIEDYKKEHKKNPINEIDESNFSYEWFPLETVLAPYASGDTDCTLRIFNVLWKKTVENPKWVDLILNFYTRLTVTLARMESYGLKADQEYMDKLDVEYEKEEERLVDLIREDPNVKILEEEHRGLYEMGLVEFAKPVKERDKEIVGLRTKYKSKLSFNPNSPDDKGRLMFDIIGARPPASKDTVKDSAVRKKEDDLVWSDYKTDKNNVAWIKANMPEYEELMGLFARYSSVRTLRSTFVTGLGKAISDVDGAVHGMFNITGTDTSRLSSSSPNLQNIPSSHQNVKAFDYDYPIKRIFVSRFEGGAIAQLDYSALEMRVLALIAKDENMTQAFLENKDTHKNTASIVFGKPEEEVTKDERQASKKVAFGISYGQGTPALAEELNISNKEAEEIYNKFLANKPKIRHFIEDTHAFVEANGYVETLQGHRRILRDVWGDQQTKAGALRQSVNTIIQGTGAYLTNLAVVMIGDYLEQQGKRSKLVATVHDSIVLDMPHEEIAEVASVAKFIMENLPIDFLMIPWEGKTIRFPVTADAEIGTSYKDVVDFDAELFKQFKSVYGYTKYHKDLGKFDDYEASKLITAEQRDEGQAMIEANLESYKNI